MKNFNPKMSSPNTDISSQKVVILLHTRDHKIKHFAYERDFHIPHENLRIIQLGKYVKTNQFSQVTKLKISFTSQMFYLVDTFESKDSH